MTRAELLERLQLLHPTANIRQLSTLADAYQNRYEAMEKALNAALANGRDLRERFLQTGGFGDYWPEMYELEPAERVFVMDELKRHLGLPLKS